MNIGYEYFNLINTSCPRGLRGTSVYGRENARELFERLGIPYTDSCSKRGGTYLSTLVEFCRSKTDEELLNLMEDRYNNVLTHVAIMAENEYRARHPFLL